MTSPPLPAIQVVTARSTGERLGGFRLGVDELSRHPDYRGPELVALGLELARDGYLDARIIGEASATGRHDPQSLKRVWHLVARFGR